MLAIRIIPLLLLLRLGACAKEPLPKLPEPVRLELPINKEKREMAKKSSTQTVKKAEKPKRKRPGVHAKSRVDWSKGKPGWKKPYRGQGR